MYLWKGRKHQAMHTGRLRTAGASDASGVSIRALKEGRVTFSKTSGLQETDIGWAIDHALASVGRSPERSHFTRFPDPVTVPGSPASIDPALVDPDPDRLIATIESAEDAAMDTPSVDYFQAGLSSNWGMFVVVNSRGVEVWDHHAHESLIVELRCRRGTTRKVARSAVYDRQPLDRDSDVAAMTRRTARRADSATQPGTLPEARTGVILDVQATAILLAHLIPAFVGRAALEGRTAFSGRLDERVAAEAFSLWDRPQGPGGCRQQRIDDEGTPTSDLALIDQGVLANYLFDWSGALESEQPPTGHGFRGLTSRYATPPGPRAANLHIEPGDWTLDEMIEDTDEGVLVMDELMGGFTLNHTTGDFSTVAPMAFRIDGGEIAGSLVSTTVAGNLFDMLENITAIGSGSARYPAGQFVPLRLEGITCAT